MPELTLFSSGVASSVFARRAGAAALCALLLTGCASPGTLADSRAAPPTTAEAPRNVILFLGDGMGISTITAARIYAGQKLGKDGESHALSFEAFEHLALIKTYNTDLQVPDSAGTMSSIITGHKTRAGVISVGAEPARGDCAAALEASLPTLLEEAEIAGYRSGLISTARITHATPAATYAHSPDRDWEDDSSVPAAAAEAGCVDIARQLVEFPAGDGVDLILGGGRANFMATGTADPEYGKPLGRRLDGADLIAQWQGEGADRRYAWNRQQWLAAMAEATPGRSQVLGLFEPSHLQWEADRNQEAEPSLAEMTAAAIDFLSADNEQGYFLLVEGGRIDHAHHYGNAYRALEDTVALDAAVATALERVDLANTLIVVTADHSHTLTISGYPRRGNPILGKVTLADGRFLPDEEGRPYTTLSYANGPGARGAFPDLTDVDTGALDYQQRATVPMPAETHAGEDVAAYATGPTAELLGGVMEQNEIYGVLRAGLFGQRGER
ncbi:MAG: alkaline phosphatase [Pseudomonadota bacterium]